MSDLAPFEQLPFEELPRHPPRPHRYGESEGHETVVSSEAFGAVETHYRTYGDGPPLLLVHGLMTSSYSWRYVFEPLGEHFRLFAPDLPGAGESEKPTDVDYAPRSLARWLGAFQRELGIRGAPVVGNSLGGYLAMWLALLDDDATSAVVNLHGPGIPTARLRALSWLGHVPGTRRFVAWLARRHPARWAHEHVHYYDESLKCLEEAEMFGKPLGTRAGSLAFAKYLLEALDPTAMRAFCGHLEQLRDEGGGFPCRLLLLYAERDPLVPPEIGARLAELVPDAAHVTLPEASHFAQVDAPEAFADHLFAFLDRP